MKMKTTKCLFLAAAALTLTACSNDDENLNGGPVAAQVTAGIGGVQTRASGTTWDSGDAIGISTIGSTLTSYANMKYTTSGDGNFTHAAELGGEDSGMFFQDADETVTFRAYYPFHGNEYIDAGTISDVTTDDQTKQSTFDFLFAKEATASKSQPTVSFNNTVKENTSFTHRMSRLVLNITTDANAGFTASDVAKGTYSLSGIKHSGTFDTQNGTATATGDPTPDWKITAANTGTGDEFTYSMIFYPQQNASLTFKATINGQDYTCELTPALAAATSYTYNITVKKTKLEVSNCEIADWGSGVTVDIDAK